MPELVFTDGAVVGNDYVLSGTQRHGPYTADYSEFTVLSSWRHSFGYMYGAYGIFEQRALSNVPYIKCRTPNVSAVDFGNLLSVTRSYCLGGLANGNKNMLSINLAQLKTVKGDSAMGRFAAGSNVPCSLPELNSISGGSCASYAWSCVSANDSPQAEYFLPKLTSVVGSYSMNHMMYFYQPKTGNTALDLSKCTMVSGNGAMQYAFRQSYFTDITLGVAELNNNSASCLQYIALSCPNLTSFSFPNLTSIKSAYALYKGFDGCISLTSIEFPKLTQVSSIYAFYNTFSNCLNLKEIRFPELTAAYGNAPFYCALDCTADTVGHQTPISVYLPKLKTYTVKQNGGGFGRWQSVTNANRKRPFKMFLGKDALTEISGATSTGQAPIMDCRNMLDIYLPSVSSITGSYVFNGCGELTGIHFAAAYETSIRASAGFASLWGRGAGAATVFFDL